MFKALLRLLFGDNQNRKSSERKERFTICSRNVLSNASDEVKRLQQPIIEPHHLLVGILQEPESTAFDILQKSGLTISLVESKIPASLDSGNAETAHPDLSNQMKKILEYSVDEARRFGHTQVGTEHLLLAIMRLKNSLAYEMLNESGINYQQVRTWIFEMPQQGQLRESVSEPPSDSNVSQGG